MTENRKRDTIIFDLDGTLLNTLDDLADSVNYALRTCGYPEREKKEVRKFIGGGASVLVNSAVPEGLSEEEKIRCREIFLAYYLKHSNDKTNLYDGIYSVVTRLAEIGFKMGVVSSKGDVAVKKLILDYFGEKMPVAIGETPGIAKKPAPDSVLKAIELLGSVKEKSIYVGDSEVDVETAKNTGIPCVIVTWGFRDREELKRFQPDYMADTPEELYEILKALF